MRRSLSQSFKGKKGCFQNKQLSNTTSSFGFKTVWKFRNGHQSNASCCQKMGNKSVRNSNASFVESASNSTHRKSMNKIEQQQIKAYIRNMKNTEKQKAFLQNEKQIKIQENKEILCQSRIKSQTFIENENSTLEKLSIYEKRLEQLIRLKLMKKGPNIFCKSRNYEDELELEIKNILNQVKLMQLSTLEEENADMDAEIDQIQRKIMIFEKLIAESTTESEMLKKFFYAKRIIRKPVSQAKNFNNLKGDNLKNLTFTGSTLSSPSIHFETTNQASFKKPEKSYYKESSKLKKVYVPQKQTVPRSVYQRQFLNYGGLPVYRFTQTDNFIESKSLSHQKQSVYLCDFKEKKIQLHDTKNLDCKRDKIKASDIMFMDRSQNINQKKFNTNKGKENTRLQNKGRKDQSDLLLGTKSLWIKDANGKKQIGMKMQSQKQSEFCNKKVTIQNIIKDKSLMSMKYTFKRLAQV